VAVQREEPRTGLAEHADQPVAVVHPDVRADDPGLPDELGLRVDLADHQSAGDLLAAHHRAAVRLAATPAASGYALVHTEEHAEEHADHAYDAVDYANDADDIDPVIAEGLL
jgi:hypothetical protein